MLAAAVAAYTRLQRRQDATWLAVATATTALASLGLVTYYGFGLTGDPHRAGGFTVAIVQWRWSLWS